MTRKREDISAALDATLSGVSHDPGLFYSVVNASKGDVPPVKRKMTFSMALALILILITGTVAVAVTYHGVSYFLTEKTADPVSLDPDYLMNDPSFYHSSEYLIPTVVDAYWDGLEFYVAYHVSPAISSHVLRMACDNPEHTHVHPTGDADILLHEPAFISLTDENGDLSQPRNFSFDWVYEDDGSLSVMVRFQCYDRSQYTTIGIPIFHTITATGKKICPVLHYDPPKITTNPIADHEHDWTPATCLSLKTCTICQRAEDGLGYHQFLLSEDETKMTCAVCEKTMTKPVNVPSTTTLLHGDENALVLAVQLRLHDLGYYQSPFTGVYTDETAEAVKAYQKDMNLIPDGVCGSSTVQLLFHVK